MSANKPFRADHSVKTRRENLQVQGVNPCQVMSAPNDEKMVCCMEAHHPSWETMSVVLSGDDREKNLEQHIRLILKL